MQKILRAVCSNSKYAWFYPYFQRVKSTFLDFDVEASVKCYDRLVIYDGSDQTADEMQTFCGSNLPTPIESTSNVLFMFFMSDQDVTLNGFKLQYDVISKWFNHFQLII